jgi:hypothetical protein
MAKVIADQDTVASRQVVGVSPLGGVFKRLRRETRSPCLSAAPAHQDSTDLISRAVFELFALARRELYFKRPRRTKYGVLVAVFELFALARRDLPKLYFKGLT